MLAFMSSSCHKSVQLNTNTGTNEFTLTVAGKTFNANNSYTYNSSANSITQSPAGTFMQASASELLSVPPAFYFELACNIKGNFQCDLTAVSNTGNAIGIYTVTGSNYTYYFTDSIAGYIIYTIGSTSTITVTESDSNWVTGTMNFDLINQGNHYPATGNFKITGH